MNTKKNIAVVLTGTIEIYQSGILNGIYEYSKDKNCNVVFFQCINGGVYKEKYDLGEHNILELVNFEDYDGAIVLPNTIRIEEHFNSVVNKIKKANIPIVTIEYEIDNTYFVGTDNYGSMKEMINHMIKHHNCRKINFITGYLSNLEAIARFKAYKDALEENNIPYEEDRVYYGRFIVSDGEKAVKAFSQSPLGLPEVIICSNDEMAMGVYDELTRKGIKIPEQVKIAGFDNIKRAEYNKIPLASVNRSLDKIGATSFETILKILNGEKVQKTQLTPSFPVYTTSCGCPENKVKINKNIEYTYDSSNTTISYVYSSSRMLADLNSSVSLDDMFERLKPWVLKAECEEFYLCLCSDWEGNSENLTNFETDYRTTGYSDIMIPALSYKNNKFDALPEFKKEKLIPVSLNSDKQTKYYIFAPLHFQDRCLGYCVLCSNDFLLENNITYTSYVLNIINSLEMIRRENQLKILLNHLNKLSLSDGLTGIFNRHGFNKYANEVISDPDNKNTQMLLTYFDLDGLKAINDSLGHEEGDVAIKALAQALVFCARPHDIIGRLGGDEFVFLGTNYTAEEADDFCSMVEQSLIKYNANATNDFLVSASFGYYLFTPQDGMELSNYIDIADGKMYKAKYEKKKNNARKKQN